MSYCIPVIALCMLVVSMSGCQLLSGAGKAETTLEAPSLPSVEVAGDIQQPGVLTIPSTGLTLHQAILRAGGAKLGTDLKQDDLFAALHRRKGSGGDVHYFPLPLVESDLLGMIELRNGDLIRIVKMVDTSWRTTQARHAQPFVVVGMVEKPGNKQTRVIMVQRMSNFIQLEQPSGVGTAKQGNDYANALVVSRAAASGVLQEHFYVPTLNSAVNNGQMTDSINKWLTANIAGGDRIEYTQVGRLPIVLSSLAQHKILEARTSMFQQQRKQQEADTALPWSTKAYRWMKHGVDGTLGWAYPAF